MSRSLPDAWGSARGPLGRLTPSTRLGTTALVFAACLIARPETPAGLALLLASVAGWLWLCRPPGRLLAAVGGLGAIVFLPLFGLAFWIEPAAGTGRWFAALGLPPAWAVPWRIAGRGIGSMLVASAGLASLSRVDFSLALERLWLPRLVKDILAQIVHQTGNLLAETGRIRDALAVRSARSGRGAGLRLAAALPRVWLPRVLDRAERVAAAMEVRGYRPGIGLARPRRPGALDAAAWLAALVLLAAAVCLGVLP